MDYYQEGMDANAEGLSKSDCPYADRSSERVQWMRGFNDFQPIRDEWEAANHERARHFA